MKLKIGYGRAVDARPFSFERSFSPLHSCSGETYRDVDIELEEELSGGRL